MKFLKRITIALAAWLMVSCEATDLDLTQDPNTPAPDQAGVQFLYNAVFANFIATYEAAHFFGDGPARMVAFGASTYEEGIGPTSLNGLWNTVYAGLFPDVDALAEAADELSLHFHTGTAKIMKAYAMVVLVDLLGDVPYSEAGGGISTIAPQRDSGASVYAAAEALLDEGITLLNLEAPAPDFDPFYNGDAEAWIKFANTVKMKMYVNMRLTDASAGSKFQAIINNGDFISEPADDMQFQFGIERNNPNSRHPFYNNSYESSDGTYMSNYYMWLLFSEKRKPDGSSYTSYIGDLGYDPRIRFYFYRQDTNITDDGTETFECFFDVDPFVDRSTGEIKPPPPHYQEVDVDMPYCFVTADGYYGRDHGNGEGIPPDGPVRTVYGLYPGGGLYDDDQATFAQELGTLGGQGVGIHPIMLSSFVNFMRAEMALTAGTADDPKAMLSEGAARSIEKVYSFISLIPNSTYDIVVAKDPVTEEEITVGDTYLNPVNLDTLKDIYLDNLNQIYDNVVAGNYNGSGILIDRLDVVMKEYLIAAWGNGYETYNNIRRTGRPLNHQPMLETSPGIFVYSCYYPSNHVNFNPNATQKESLGEHVFWDNNPDTTVR